MRLTFLGATGTVTGSKYLVEAAGKRLLVDCGLFQGLKQLRLRNWGEPPVDPKSLDAVILTHAHIDHSGYLPLMVKKGFRGPIYATAATRDLCAIMLPDSGHLQEEEAGYAIKRGYSKHRPALPLYTEEDAVRAMEGFRAVPVGEDFPLAPGLALRLARSGHILGSAFVSLSDGRRTLTFSGDLGRPHDGIMLAPERIERADYLVLESTYGDRLHDKGDPAEVLAEVVGRTARRGGVVLVPAFAVGRAQAVLYYLDGLRESGRIPDIPVYLNSPMATRATRLYVEHPDEHRMTAEDCEAMFARVRYAATVEESKALNERKGPMAIISASGMATGGRVLHHLKAFAPDGRNTILFTGYQAPGTRGASILGGAESVKIHGAYVPIRAEVRNIENLSAHADYEEILSWLGGFAAPPRTTFLTHGDPAASDALRKRIEERMGWPVVVPDFRDAVDLA
ncbi:MAG: MBL fold metallo-hydrolase [Candidatus Methylomirabilis sp.]|nr:MBL fold metallo-hydrolase [Deltaproteobacteria bacterium]